MNEACWWPCGVFEPTCIGTRQDPNLFWSGVCQILVNRRRDQWELATNRSRQTIMRGKGGGEGMGSKATVATTMDQRTEATLH